MRGSDDVGIELPVASSWAKFVYPLATSLLARRGGSWSDSLAEAQRIWDQNGAALASQNPDRGIGDDDDGVLSKTKGLYENEHEEKRFTHKSN
jgi:hypothetical protein